jgi:predicted kinase
MRREWPSSSASGGIPGAGKTTVARQLAEEIVAIHIEIDVIEAAIRRNLKEEVEESDRYRAAYGVGQALTESLLRSGHMVIADSLNSIPLTRGLWVNAAKNADAHLIEVEVISSDQAEHRQRLIEGRDPSRPGTPRSFAMANTYQPWDRERIVIDTATTSVGEAVATIRKAITVA